MALGAIPQHETNFAFLAHCSLHYHVGLLQRELVAETEQSGGENDFVVRKGKETMEMMEKRGR